MMKKMMKSLGALFAALLIVLLGSMLTAEAARANDHTPRSGEGVKTTVDQAHPGLFLAAAVRWQTRRGLQGSRLGWTSRAPR